MHKSNLIGVDLAKNVFLLAIADDRYHINSTKRLSRHQFYQFFLQGSDPFTWSRSTPAILADVAKKGT